VADAARRSDTVGPSIGKLLKTGDERLDAEAYTLMPVALPALPFLEASSRNQVGRSWAGGRC